MSQQSIKNRIFGSDVPIKIKKKIEARQFLSHKDRNPGEEIKKYKNGNKLKVKILEIKKDENKVRVGLKQTGHDPFEWFKNKQINEAVTVKVI